MPVTLYEPGTGKAVDVTPEEAHARLEDGTLTPKKTQLVPIRLPDGKRWDIEGHELKDALAHGSQIVDPEAERHQKLVEEEEGVAGGIRAASLGLVEGAGIGPGVIRKGISAISPSAGKQFQEDVEVNQEAHPYIRMGANTAGMGLAALAAHKASGSSPARLLPAAGIDAIGSAVGERVATAVAGLGGEGALATAGRAALASGARAATEGALIGVGSHIDEQMLGDHELVGEKMAMAGVKGGVLGLGVGSVLGGAGSLVRSGASAAVRGTRNWLNKSADLASQEAALKEAEAAALPHLPEPVPAAGPVAGFEGVTPPTGPIDAASLRAANDNAEVRSSGEAINAKRAQLLEEAANLRSTAEHIGTSNPHDMALDQVWRTSNARQNLTKEVNARVEGGTRAVAEEVLNEGIIDTKKGVAHAFAEGTSEKLLSRTEKVLDRIGKEIGESVESSKANVTGKDFLKHIDDVIAPLKKTGATRPVAASLETFRAHTMESLGMLDASGNLLPGALEKRISFQDLVAQRRALQSLAFGEAKALDPAQRVASLREIARNWGQLERDALDKASGEGAGAAFKELNSKFHKLTYYRDALETAAASGTSNRAISLSDHLVGHGASMATGALAGPFGHVIGGAAGALLNKMARERGNAAAAVALTKIGDMGMVQGLMRRVDKAVEGAAKGLTSTSEKPPKLRLKSISHDDNKGRTPPLAVRYRDAVKELDAMSNHPQTVAERANTLTQDLAQHAPNVAGAFTATMSRAAVFLESKRPQPMSGPSPYSGREEPSVPATEKAEFLRYFKAAQDPMSVLADFERGTVTPEAAETFKAMAPKSFAQLQQKTMELIADRRSKGKPLPFKKCLQLGLLFDVPTHACLEPDNFNALQANVYTAPAPAQPANPTGGQRNTPKRPVKLPNQSNPLDNLAQLGPGRK